MRFAWQGEAPAEAGSVLLTEDRKDHEGFLKQKLAKKAKIFSRNYRSERFLLSFVICDAFRWPYASHAEC
jgi:hypothetical protein